MYCASVLKVNAIQELEKYEQNKQKGTTRTP